MSVPEIPDTPHAELDEASRKRVRKRIMRLTARVEELARALGLPPEARYALLSIILEQRTRRSADDVRNEPSEHERSSR